MEAEEFKLGILGKLCNSPKRYFSDKNRHSLTAGKRIGYSYTYIFQKSVQTEFLRREGRIMPDMDNRTRRALDSALRTLLERKPLAQIRVRELTELCGLRRQSFYYHFKDVYELFDWSLQRERETLLRRREDCLTWEQALRDLMEHLTENRAYYRAILDNQGRKGLRTVFELSEMLAQAFSYYWSRCGLLPDPAAEQMQMQCGETVLLSLLENWLRGELELEPEAMLSMVSKAVDQSIAGATLRTLREQGGLWAY